MGKLKVSDLKEYVIENIIDDPFTNSDGELKNNIET